MYRFKDTPQELPELVVDALNLFGYGIRHVWIWALLVSLFSLVAPLTFESIEFIAGEVHATVRWYMIYLNILLSVPGAFCVGMITRRLFVMGAAREESVRASMKLVMGKLIPIYIGLFFASLISIIGWFFVYLPGIFFGVVFAFVTPLILLDDYPILEAFKESWNLVIGNWWRIFAMLLFPLLILVMAGLISINTAPLVSATLHSMILLFDIPLLLTFILTMFYDTKLRHAVPLHLKEDEQKPENKGKEKSKSHTKKSKSSDIPAS